MSDSKVSEYRRLTISSGPFSRPGFKVKKEFGVGTLNLPFMVHKGVSLSM